MTEKPTYQELERKIIQLEQDALGQKMKEGALKKSNELFQKTFESQFDAIFVLDAQNPPTITDCNPAAERVFGYSRQEMLGRTTGFLHTSEDGLREFQQELYPAVTKQGFFHLRDFAMKRKSNTVFYSEHTVVPLKNEEQERIGWVSVVRDITSQKQMEETILKSNERYRLLADNVSDVLFMRDMNLNFTYISPSVERLTGYSVEEAMALTMAEAYTPDSIKLAMEAFSEELSKEKAENSDPSRVCTLEMEGYRKDGTTIWTETKMRFVRDSNGHPIGILGVSRDITKRKRAEMAMRISEERYRSLVEDMPALVCRFRPDGTWTFVNDNFCDYFGRERESLIGQDFLQFIPEEERRKVKEHFTSLTKESPVVSYEHQVIASDGTRGWHQRTDRALFDEAGNLKEYQCHGLDVTERKRVEEALHEKDAIFSAFLEHSPIYVFFKDKDIRSIHLSRNYEQLLGMPLDQVIGKTMDEIFPPDLAKSMIADDKRVLREGKRLDVVEELGGRTYETIKFPVNKDGVPFILAGFTMDVTERKLSVEALKENERALEAQTRHLEEVNTALKILLDHREAEKQEMRKDMLNNLKNMVLPYIEKIGKSVLDPESKTYLGIIKSNLEELISPLLRISQSGDSTLTPTELNVADFIRHGKTSKEISEFLGVSINAISVHRYNIRRRLGILNKKMNLRSYLQNLSQ